MAIRKRQRSDGSTAYNAEVFIGLGASRKTGKDINLYDRATFDTKREAQDWLANHRVSKNKNPSYNPRAHEKPFGDLVDSWRATALPTMAPRSKQRAEQVLSKYLIPEFGRETVGGLTRKRLNAYFARLRDTDLALGTVKKVHSVLSSILAAAVEDEFMATNPAARLTSLKRGDYDDARELVVLTGAEVRALADAIGERHPPYRTMVLTAAFTGLRASELHALRRRDVDLMRGELYVRRAIKIWRNGEPQFGIPKTNSSRRTVVLIPELVALLSEHLANHRPDDLVFTSMVGGGAVHQVAFIKNWFHPARERVLPDHAGLRFHDLRHAFVSMLIHQGVNVKAIAKQTGHAKASLVWDVYGHLYSDADQQVRQALSAEFNAQPAAVTPLRPRVATPITQAKEAS